MKKLIIPLLLLLGLAGWLFSEDPSGAGQDKLDIQEFLGDYQRILSEFKSMPFNNPITITTTTQKEINDMFAGNPDGPVPAGQPGRIRVDGSAQLLRNLGLMPSGIDLAGSLAKGYAATTAGYYVPPLGDGGNEIRLNVTVTPEEAIIFNKMSSAKRKEKIDNEWGNTIIHELTHALQYQNAGFLAQMVRTNSDLDRALKAFREGEASLASYYYALKYSPGRLISGGTGPSGVSVKKGDLSSRPPRGSSGGGISFGEDAPLDPMTILKYYLSQIAGAANRAWENGQFNPPQYINRSMNFPYLKGLDFAQKIYDAGGWEAVNKFYEEPPLSTEQILHPHKYKKDFPLTIELPNLDEVLTPEWKTLISDVMGEFTLELLFREYLPKENPTLPADGWGGDLCVLMESTETGQSFLAWFLAWDDQDNALGFFGGYKRLLSVKYPSRLALVIKGKEAQWSDGTKCGLAEELIKLSRNIDSVVLYKIPDSDNVIWLERKGSRTLLIEGIPENILSQVRSEIWAKAKQKEIKSIKEFYAK